MKSQTPMGSIVATPTAKLQCPAEVESKGTGKSEQPEALQTQAASTPVSAIEKEATSNKTLTDIAIIEDLLDSVDWPFPLPKPPVEKSPKVEMASPLVMAKETAESQAIHRIDAKLEKLIEQSAKLEREKYEIEELRSQLEAAIKESESRITDSNHGSMAQATNEDLTWLTLENSRLSNLLTTSRTEYKALLEFIETDDVNKLTDSIRKETSDHEREMCLEIEQLREQVAFLTIASQSDEGHGDQSDLQELVNDLRQQLIESRHETVEVRMQCNELTTRLSQYQAPLSHSSESYSWEERKQAWLRQLEHETQCESSIQPSKVLEIEKLIEQTNQEVLRRDKEIADLQSLLLEQSVASSGMAVGAAAISQVIEADDLIVEERQRLKQLQEDWEQKQRQGEIEMSLERAKLARERLELQERLRSLEAACAANDKDTSTFGKAKGNWLARLGLRDE